MGVKCCECKLVFFFCTKYKKKKENMEHTFSLFVTFHVRINNEVLIEMKIKK